MYKSFSVINQIKGLSYSLNYVLSSLGALKMYVNQLY